MTATLETWRVGIGTRAGIGPKRVQLFARLGVETVLDLLLLEPRRLAKGGEPLSIPAAKAAIGRHVRLCGTLRRPSVFRYGRRRSVLRCVLRAGEEKIELRFFNQAWLRESLLALAEEGSEVEVEGRVSEDTKGACLDAPRIGTPTEPLPPVDALLPVYPTTNGLGQKLVRGLVRGVLDELDDVELFDPLPASWRDELGWPSLARALQDLHAPTSEERFEAARERLGLETLFAMQAALVEGRAEARERATRVALTDELVDAVFGAEGWDATPGQREALTQIAADLGSERPMRRLLQGEVGSGKTLVALVACLATARAGGQAALFVPTDVLASQHASGLARLARRWDLPWDLLTGSLSGAERRAARARIASGETRLVIGTHALASADVRFRRLDLVVIDEQQRFGVACKAALLAKGRGVHMLLMTATPIPRTLALTLYGDLEVSTMRDRPAGRGEVRTHLMLPQKREDADGFLAERVARGERVFWIAPRIGGEEADEEAEPDATPSLEETAARLAEGPLAEFGIEVVHGRLDPAVREAALERFRAGATRLLVATTVIEVGVDVPEATVMVIDGAERFGLAQLHQLRGRVGRGTGDAVCILFAEARFHARLRVLAQSCDGFRIAEEDLGSRGMGELGGQRQAGHYGEAWLRFAGDPELVERIRALLAASDELRAIYLARTSPNCPDLV